MRPFAASLALVSLCALAQASAHAQALSDPMRPPNARASGAQSGGTPPPGPGLQAVLTSPSRNLAVIDGVVVPLGSTVRSGTLSSVSDSVVVVRKNGAREVLLMHPDIDKKPSRREPQ